MIDTGDRVDGNGLYDGSTPKGKHTYDIFKQQHIDIICTGNHELYEAATADREWTQTVPNFKDNYLASNLDIIDPKTGNRTALARRYKRFTTKNRKIDVLAFGFLFDFTGNANNTFVQSVEETIRETWFQQAIRQKVDVFVVIGHVALRSPEYKAIYEAIRSQNWNTAIQFFGGHSHIRDYMSYDEAAHAIESGRYMETIGWMSIDNIGPQDVQTRNKKLQIPLTTKASPTFRRRYIDNNLYGYYHHTGLNHTTFSTNLGRNVSVSISAARIEMDLDKRYGCAPRDLYLNRAPYPSNSSILSWLDQQVLPDILASNQSIKVPKLAIINSGAVRFDLFAGPYTRDTVFIVCPFRNQFRVIKDVPYESAALVSGLLNSGGKVLHMASESDVDDLQDWHLAPPEQIYMKEDFIASIDIDEVEKRTISPELTPGYTTKDDGGHDGDDTIHKPISFYRVPNVVESRIDFGEKTPSHVDLVFIDFVQPWILAALKYLGQDVNSSITESFLEGQTFTAMMQEWVSENWNGDC